eukprot:gene19908-39458_t
MQPPPQVLANPGGRAYIDGREVGAGERLANPVSAFASRTDAGVLRSLSENPREDFMYKLNCRRFLLTSVATVRPADPTLIGVATAQSGPVVDIDLLTPEGTVAVFQSLTAQARLGLFGSDPQKY